MDEREVVFPALGLAFGLGAFYTGFVKLRLKKLIEAMATSKVRSMAMGTVELCGRALPAAPLADPIYGEPCVYFKVRVREKRGSGKRSRWVTVYERDSSEHPFVLQDDTGRVLVSPSGADAYFETDLDVGNGMLFGRGDERAVSFMNGVAGGGGGLFGRSRRLTAQIVRGGEPVYVLGYACPLDGSFSLGERVVGALSVSWAEAARRLKADVRRMMALDVNEDGSIDAQEWDRGVAAYREELRRQPGQAPAAPALAARVCRSPEGLLVLSDKTEKELVRSLFGTTVLRVFGGAVLALASAAFLAWRFLGL